MKCAQDGDAKNGPLKTKRERKRTPVRNLNCRNAKTLGCGIRSDTRDGPASLNDNTTCALKLAAFVRHVLGVRVTRRRRPGGFDKRNNSSAHAIELTNHEALFLDVGQRSSGTTK